MNLSEEDKKLIDIAAKLVKPALIPGGVVSEVGSALRTTDGEIYTGVCMHLVCGLGTCAEYAAIAAAVTNAGAITIDIIVAVDKQGIIPPCGRCRELMSVLSVNSSKTQVILSTQEKVLLAALLPRAWKPTFHE